jgi:hypothetical protein
MRILAALALLMGACGGGSSYEVSDQPLAGTVGGAPWTFVAGHTDAFLSEGEDDFFAELYAEAFAPCGFATPQGSLLLVAVPKEPGEYEMSLQLNMTFVANDENLVATDGVIVVEEVTATTVTGGVHGVFDDDNQVDGRFTLTICADTP